ncbi:MAG: mechanosensitive ion channel family protein, partial [Ilumatobacteraceae bacterium]
MRPVPSVEWSEGIEEAWSDIASFVPKLFGFLVILIVGYFIAKFIAKAA